MSRSHPQRDGRSRSPETKTGVPRERSGERAQDRATPRTASVDREDGWYKVFIPKFDTVNPDPLEDYKKRLHDGIFVENDPANSKGDFYNVTGDLMMANGMPYATKRNHDVIHSRDFANMTQIGWIHEKDSGFSEVNSILIQVERPARQQGINFTVKDHTWNKVVWIEADGTPSPNNIPTRPVRKCNEWTQDAAEALRKAGVLKSTKD
ncbi:hypothetical protein N7462_006490 [Penicillium macrosclerotiorum]|uniref:uncharacterized protein n=1 Tax=Penicillium macrosclerotiorum TaxID=303699 RepID=UPI0025476B14|nr:uncharacterized protein N7462_006490 [Penicillium macrosclerotiorum]KAJ5683325.1 hypothetical protein N7462_006490 [Penicillium macrosclerotiorum]